MVDSNTSVALRRLQISSIRRSVTYTGSRADFSVRTRTRQKPNQRDTPNINQGEAGIVKHVAEIRFLICPKTHIEVALVQVLFVTSLITKSLRQIRSSFKPKLCSLSLRLKPRPRLQFCYPSAGTSQLDVDYVILKLRWNFIVCNNSYTITKLFLPTNALFIKT